MKDKRLAAMGRESEFHVDDLFIHRWSPRAISGEEIDPKDLMSLFEAVRWAPSCFNNQHWRFLYARKNAPGWKKFFDLLVEMNKIWVKNAAVLVVIVSKKTFDRNNKPFPTHSFDTGAAWQNIALQGYLKGWVVHAMAGFDYDKAKEVLGVPDDHQVEAMVAVGKPGRKEDLPEGFRENEIPSGRKKISEIAVEGTFWPKG